MAKLLRRVQYKTVWDPHGEASEYLPPDQAPADALSDLATKGNALSLWEIDDSGSNLERVLAAVASRRENLQKLDYLIFDAKHVGALNLTMERARGDTHDRHANENWHFHVVRVSASDLASLANKMFEHGETKRQNERSLISLLKKSVGQGFVDQSMLHANVLAKLGEP